LFTTYMRVNSTNMFSSLLLLLSPVLLQDQERDPVGRVTAYRLDHVETLQGDALEKAVILVRDGMIERIGQAVIVPRGAEVVDLRGKGATAMPPFVLSHATSLQTATRGRGRNAKYRGIDTVWLSKEDTLKDYLERGVLLASIDPPGSGFPGRTSVVRTTASLPVPEALVDDLHLKVTVEANRSAMELLRSAFKDADSAIEKEKQAKLDWEKARKEWEEKQKSKAEEAKKKDSEKKEAGKDGGKDGAAKDADGKNGKDGKEEDKEPPKEFTPPKIDANLEPILDWVRKERVAQVWLDSASEWVHWQDVLKEQELSWELVLSHGSSHNFHEVIDDIAQAGVRVDIPAQIAKQTRYTRIRINLAAELVAAGLEKLILRPSRSGVRGVDSWRVGVAALVREGLDRQIALKAMTLEPAASIGQEEIVGPLIVGAAANFIILDGDPLDPLAEVLMVIEDGKRVYDREKEEDR
jgi:hypothetical protein